MMGIESLTLDKNITYCSRGEKSPQAVLVLENALDSAYLESIRVHMQNFSLEITGIVV